MASRQDGIRFCQDIIIEICSDAYYYVPSRYVCSENEASSRRRGARFDKPTTRAMWENEVFSHYERRDKADGRYSMVVTFHIAAIMNPKIEENADERKSWSGKILQKRPRVNSRRRMPMQA